jgi:hypothetical protein
MRQLISLCFFLIRYSCLYSLCILGVNGNLQEVYFNNLERTNNFLYTVRYENHIFSTNIFATNRTMNDSKELLVDNSGKFNCIYNTVTYDEHFESPENYDTLSQSDIVRHQYALLPYPPVSPQDLEIEEKYYDNGGLYAGRKSPFRVTHSLTFEALNNFLYKGINTFR